MKNMIKKIRTKELRQIERGFTLIELILYMGMLSILMTVLSAIFGTILDVQTESASTSSVDQDGRYILSRLTYDFNASHPTVLITPDTPGAIAQTLELQLNNEVSDTFYSIDGNDNLVKTGPAGTFTLNSYDTKITNFTVTRLGLNDSQDTVRVNFTLESRISQPSGNETRNITATFSQN
jgi:type II secretory pathway pseudopilin PulG